MTRNFRLFLAAFVLLGMTNKTNAQTFSGGDGSPNNPYLITTAAELAQLATLVNAGDGNYNSKHYKLANDIDLSAYGSGFNGGKGWIPIGTYGWHGMFPQHPFRGLFNGDGNVITGLYINDSLLGTGAGLFGYVVKTGVGVMNLTVENVNIRAGAYIGGVVGYLDSAAALWKCNSSGNIRGGSYLGGLVGMINPVYYIGNSLWDCYSSCNVSGSLIYVGGLVGKLEELGEITNCYSTGNVSGGDYVGGIVGWLSRRNNLRYCYSTGNISGNDFVGGIVGFTSASFLWQGYSTGSITGNRHVGGIAGLLEQIGNLCCEVTIQDFVALNPSVKGNDHVGRVIGTNNANNLPTINNAAYDSLLNDAGTVTWNNKGADQIDGEDISKEIINTDGTLGGRFTDTTWTTQKGKLPGLFGKAVDMPEHLRMGGVGVGQLRITNYELRVYPNPTRGQLHITRGHAPLWEDADVTIYSVVGQVVMQAPLNPPEGGKLFPSFGGAGGGLIIDVSHLAKGMYFLRIDGKVVKFVKE